MPWYAALLGPFQNCARLDLQVVGHLSCGKPFDLHGLVSIFGCLPCTLVNFLACNKSRNRSIAEASEVTRPWRILNISQSSGKGSSNGMSEGKNILR